MRTGKTIKNISTKFVSQIILIALGFVSRRVMIDSVGVGYLGINGLLSNIFTILSLAESGIGVAIVYSLYKPLAEGNKEVIKSLMRFYKKAYLVLALFTLVIGLIVFPFLGLFMKDNTIANTHIIYLMFLFSAVSSYMFSYKVSLNNADQNQYRFTIANTVTQIVVLIIKMIILITTSNYILFLAIDIISNLIKNVAFSRYVDAKYSYIKEKNVLPLESEVWLELKKNIKALFITKIGYVTTIASDNLVISSYISIHMVGLYSNYVTLFTSVASFLGIIMSGATASLGNVIAKESKEKIYDVFEKLFFLNAWFYSVCSVCLLVLTEDFISLWVGDELRLGYLAVIVIVSNFLIMGIVIPINTVKTVSGIYHQDRYINFIVAIVNLVLSMILVGVLGIVGVILGTVISNTLLSFWIRPYIVYKEIFHKNLLGYFYKISKLLVVTVISALVSLFIHSIIVIEIRIADFLVSTIVIFLISNAIYLISYFRNKELVYYYKLCIDVLSRIFIFKERSDVT